MNYYKKRKKTIKFNIDFKGLLCFVFSSIVITVRFSRPGESGALFSIRWWFQISRNIQRITSLQVILLVMTEKKREL